MNNKIIDTFIFYNELEMLNYRLNYLYDYVDKFVLVEATLTHSGKNKELFYENNKQMFEKYSDKIIHIILDDLPDINRTDDAWKRENFHRNGIERGIKQIELEDNDIIIISDLDEIPDRNIIKLLRNEKLQNTVYALEQDMYYYNLTCKAGEKWYFAKLLSFNTYKLFQKKPQDIRMAHNTIAIKFGGWHFSYFGNVDFIQNKIKHFAHQEYNDEKYYGKENILKQIESCGDLFLRDNKNQHNFQYCPIENNNYLPENYTQLTAFTNLLL